MNIGNDSTNTNRARAFCPGEAFADIIAEVIAIAGIQNKKKKTKNRTTLIIIAVSPSLIIPPIPREMLKPTMGAAIKLIMAAINVGISIIWSNAA